MAIQPAVSGTYDYGLSGLDLSLEVFERCGIRGAAILPDHSKSLLRTVNLVQSMWSNRGVNLWKVTLTETPLTQGVVTYNVAEPTVMMLDVYLRNYYMNTASNITPNFTTTLNSTTVTVNWTNHGLLAGQFFSCVAPVSIGGLIILGFYPVVTVLSANAFTITAATAATSGASGGVLPVFTTAANSPNCNVYLPNHGLSAGNQFVVQIQVTVGGVAVVGVYTVVARVDANNFTIALQYNAGSIDVQTENSGLASVAGQAPNAQPFDRIMTPISRNDYAALPNKYIQQPPTQFWFNRQAFQPQVSVYPAPDQNGPYSMFSWNVTQIYDAGVTVSDKPDVPYRFLEALCADCAAHFAMKWAPASAIALAAYAEKTWIEAAGEDRERVSSFMNPDFSGYFS